MSTVELHLAFRWICDSCGKDNYCNSASLSKDDFAAMRHLVDGELPEDDGVFQTMPSIVTCSNCGEKYETEEA